VSNFIRGRRILASPRSGCCVFGARTVNLPLVFGFRHFAALLIAAAATAPTVALLTFRMRAVLSARGILLTAGVTACLVVAAYYGRAAVPPAPMAMAHGSVGHGASGEYERVPGPPAEMPADQLEQLRCVTQISEPGGLKDDVVHVWRRGREVVARRTPEAMPGCPPSVMRSVLGEARLPADPRGRWSCTAETTDGQLVGRIGWRGVAAKGDPAGPLAAVARAQVA